MPPRVEGQVPEMTVKEVLDFCAEREVEIYTRYDFICDGLIVKMRKAAASAGFGLTIRFILRKMAAELDKGVAHDN